MLATIGYSVLSAKDGAEAIAVLDQHRPDLLLLDINLPEMNGFDVCTKVRETDSILPILMLSARSTLEDIVHGLHLGADDYIVKPYQPMELLARIGALLRRANHIGNQSAAPTTAADDDFEIPTGRVFPAYNCIRLVNGSEVALLPRDVEVFRFFHDHPGRVVSREELIAAVWHEVPNVLDRVVDQHLSRMRRRLGMAMNCIQTVINRGYRLVSDVHPAMNRESLARGDSFQFGSSIVDSRRMCIVDRKGRTTDITLREMKVLQCLVAHPDEVVTFAELSAAVADGYINTPHACGQTIYYLRGKLGEEAWRIEAVYSVGYRYAT